MDSHAIQGPEWTKVLQDLQYGGCSSIFIFPCYISDIFQGTLVNHWNKNVLNKTYVYI